MFYSGEEREREAARLEGEIAEVCGVLNATTARLVSLIAEVLATESWAGYGIRSPEHWVEWQCGVSSSRAHRLVVMARRLTELPKAAAAFTAGELSEDQVAVVARHAPVHNDAEITEFARYATVSQLSRTLRSYPFPEPAAEAPAGEEPAAPPVPERRQVSFAYSDAGRWRMWADLPADEGALVEQGLVAQRDRLFRDAEHGREVTWADALLAMAEGDQGPVDRHAVLIHLRTDAAADDPSPVAHLHGGPALPDTLRRYLTCDARVRPVWETAAKPVSVGRTRRTVPNRTRTVVEDRDRGCRTPGCTRSRWMHIHHIVHWEDGGATDTGNLISLCGFHHRAHHHGLLGIIGNADDPDGIRFTDHNGRTLKSNGHPVPPARSLEEAVPQLGIPPSHYQHPTGERLDTWSVAFSPPPARTPP